MLSVARELGRPTGIDAEEGRRSARTRTKEIAPVSRRWTTCWSTGGRLHRKGPTLTRRALRAAPRHWRTSGAAQMPPLGDLATASDLKDHG